MNNESCKNCVTPCGLRDHPNSSVCSRYDSGVKALSDSRDIVGIAWGDTPNLPKGSPPPPTPEYCWSKTPPTKEGFYWFNSAVFKETKIIKIFKRYINNVDYELYINSNGVNSRLATYYGGIWQKVKPASK